MIRWGNRLLWFVGGALSLARIGPWPAHLLLLLPNDMPAATIGECLGLHPGIRSGDWEPLAFQIVRALLSALKGGSRRTPCTVALASCSAK
eukprot:CAMPEP_0183560460 /NCGR_PEP_ID=MMETSP0371-20130417/94823_1 /TAXON_ID=268820 /ORGANISM="Peridinium aciculiferum, Strain PAER-2" /LENGTH=90 /DNA_ID=CAMNT_0025768659 /DNA_START=20 /DNA_END=289 /DNA_ORIENTATION=+